MNNFKKKDLQNFPSMVDAIIGRKLTDDEIQQIKSMEVDNEKDKIIDSKGLVFYNAKTHDIVDLKMLYDAVELDEDKKALDKEITTINKSIREDIDKSEEERREIMEVRFVEEANNSEDESKKERLLALSKAYTESYTLEPLMKLIGTEEFYDKYKRYEKRMSRLFDDYDFIIQHSYKRISLNQLHRLMVNSDKSSSIVKFTRDDADKFCIALSVACKDYDYNSKSDCWFMYCAITNILYLMNSKNRDGELYRTKIGYLERFFNKFELLYSE